MQPGSIVYDVVLYAAFRAFPSTVSRLRLCLVRLALRGMRILRYIDANHHRTVFNTMVVESYMFGPKDASDNARLNSEDEFVYWWH